MPQGRIQKEKSGVGGEGGDPKMIIITGEPVSTGLLQNKINTDYLSSLRELVDFLKASKSVNVLNRDKGW